LDSTKRKKEMPHFLPDHLMEMFAPGPPLEYKPPMDLAKKKKKKGTPFEGVAEYMQFFKVGCRTVVIIVPVPMV
jgi:U1 small nuclear ribonucleoprotein of 70kDa MW N terminal